MWVNSGHFTARSNEFEDEQETAALLVDAGWLPSGEDQKVVTADGHVLDVEILDINI